MKGLHTNDIFISRPVSIVVSHLKQYSDSSVLRLERFTHIIRFESWFGQNSYEIGFSRHNFTTMTAPRGVVGGLIMSVANFDKFKEFKIQSRAFPIIRILQIPSDLPSRILEMRGINFIGEPNIGPLISVNSIKLLAQFTPLETGYASQNDGEVRNAPCSVSSYAGRPVLGGFFAILGRVLVKLAYDANGNATARQGNSITWTSYNYPVTVNAGSGSTAETVAFSYGPDRMRWQQMYTGNGTNETTNYVGGLLEVVLSGSVTDYRHYIYAGAEPVAVYSRKTSGVNTSATALGSPGKLHGHH